jgi:hypothetical protein
MLEHLVRYTPTRAKEFVFATVELGIIEILAQGFVQIKQSPSDDKSRCLPYPESEVFTTKNLEKFSSLFVACHNFMIALKKVGLPAYREATFADSFVDWFKTLQYIRSRDRISETRTRGEQWYQIADRLWIEVGDVLNYGARVPHAELMSRGCAYARCADPDTVKAVRFECPCNQGVVYCGQRCQKA